MLAVTPRLFGAVVDHRDAEGEELDGHRGYDLVIEGEVGCKPEFDYPAELVVVVENRHVLVSEVPVRTQGVQWIEEIEVGVLCRKTLADRLQRRSCPADVEDSVEVALQAVECERTEASSPGDSATRRRVLFPRLRPYSLIAPQKLRASSSATCLKVSIRNPSQSVRAIQYL